jgi:hypothetical protein
MSGLIISVKPKANATTGSAPTTATTQVGEIAVNTYDGNLFMQISQGGTTSIVQLGGVTNFLGDVTGSGRPGSPGITMTLKNTGTAGTYTKVTTDAQGRVTSGSALGSSDVTGALGFTPYSAALMGVVNGGATLDSTGKLTTAQIPSALVGALNYQGLWNASTNSPTLASGTGTKGFMYKVSVAGTTTLDGNSSWSVNDQLIFDGTKWDKVDAEATEVASVNGQTGAVVLSVELLGDVLISSPTNGQALCWNGTQWVNQTVSSSGGGAGTVTSISSATGAITVASATTTPVLTLVPASILLSTLGGQVTASQIAPSGTSGNVLQTLSGAAQWVTLASLGLGTGPGTATPTMDGTATVGTSTLFARQDHVHPSDTSRAPLNSPALTGSPTAPTPATTSDSTAIATTAFVNALLATVTGGTY